MFWVVCYALLGWSALNHELRAQVVVLAQVLAADINIGYEEGLVNTQVCNNPFWGAAVLFMMRSRHG